MNYEYQYLLQQIKNLANKEHVISSGRAKSAEEISNSGMSIVVDTVQKYFAFKSAGLAEPVYIDPIGQKLINIKFINGVDVSKLISGITKGYGIKITDKGAGIYEIAVEEGKFALTSDVEQKVQEINSSIEAANGKVEEIENKFGDYSTTADIEKTYATKAKVEEVENKFGDYSTTADIEAKYATKVKVEEVEDKFKYYTSTAGIEAKYATMTRVNEVDSKFENYTTTADLEANYMKKNDVVPSVDSQFEVVTEFPEYYVKNEHLSQETKKLTDLGNDITGLTEQGLILNATYNILKITPPTNVKNSIVLSLGKREVFKVIFRKNVIYDLEGRYTKEFTVYVEDRKVYCPIITLDDEGKECKINFAYIDSNDFFIACDTRLDFDPYSLYRQGNLSIMFLLSQNSLVAKQPSIKCNIIEAKNVLKLHESDIHYFYKPTIITDEVVDYTYRKMNLETNTAEDITEKIQCYKMIYELPPASEYEIPINMNFKFTEHCFGNVWSLLWDGTSWTGDNVSGRSNGKIESSKLSLRVDKKYNDYGCQGCYVRCKHDDWNAKFVGTSSNFMRAMFSYGKTRLLYKDGTIADGNTQRIEIERYNASVEAYSKDGYDYLPIYLRINNSDENVVKELLNKTQKIFLDMTINGALNRLTFSHGSIYKDQNFGYYIDLVPELDSIEKINFYWSYSHITEGNRNIELYLRKDYTDPIEEVNWDPEQNAYDYIIQQQYYEILPNPNAATTLYTDFNITSSKIITADNITTMRSDLNLVTNTVDVVSYDVKDIRSNVETLNSQMAEQKQVTDCLQKDVEKNRVIAYTALAFGVAGTVGSAASIGMQLSKTGIQFAAKGASDVIKPGTSTGGGATTSRIGTWFRGIWSKIRATFKGRGQYTQIPTLHAEELSLRQTSIAGIIAWCEEEEKPIKEIEFDCEEENPEETSLSVQSTYEVCNEFRESLKPAFLKLAMRINEISDEIENLTTVQLSTITDKFDDYIAKSELTRKDIIDITYKIDSANNNLIFESEDTIHDGLLVFRPFIKLTSAVQETNRRLYIKVANGEIAEYAGIDSETTIIDPVTNENITFKGILNSQTTLENYMPDITIAEKNITIEIQNELKIVGIIIEHNSFNRSLDFTTQDFAYRCDIDALNKKIDNLAEISHNNDVQTFSLRDEFATIDEVNTVLTENYAQKTEIPNMNNYYDKSYIQDNYADFDYVTVMIETFKDTYVDNEYYDFLTSRFALKSENEEIKTKIATLDEYRKKDDLTAKSYYANLPIEHKIPDTGLYDFDSETAHAEFHDGAQLEGYAIVYNPETEKYDIHIDFSITFHSEKYDSDCNIHMCDNIISNEIAGFVWNDKTGTIYASGDAGMPVHINSAKILIEDSLALKSENEELKTKITALEAQLATLQPKYPWEKIYYGFVESESMLEYFSYTYNKSTKILTIIDENRSTYGLEYLLILHDKDNKEHYVRINYVKELAAIDEYYEINLDCFGETNKVEHTASVYKSLNLDDDSQDNKYHTFYKLFYKVY